MPQILYPIRLAYAINQGIPPIELGFNDYTITRSFSLASFCRNNDIRASDISPPDIEDINHAQATLQANKTLYITHYYRVDYNLEKELQDAKHIIKKLEKAVEVYEEAKATLEEKAQDLTDEIEDLKDELGNSQHEVYTLENALENSRTETEDALNSIKSLVNTIRALKNLPNYKSEALALLEVFYEENLEFLN